MKKLLVIPFLISLLVLPMAGLAALSVPECGDSICEPPIETPYTCPQDCEAPVTDVFDVLGSVVDWLFAALIAFAAIMIVVAAYYFVTASGNPETVAKARHFVMYALIGVLVAFLARGLVILVQRIAV